MYGSLPVRREIVQVCRRLYDRGLIAGPDGNVSVRLPGDRVLVTPAGMSKVDVTEEDLVEISLDGQHRRGARCICASTSAVPMFRRLCMHIRQRRRDSR